VSTPDEFDRWCARVNLGAMETLYAAAQERARIFEAQTNRAVEVVYPAQPPSGLPVTAREMLFMRLSLDDVEVHLYSTRNPGKYPALHVLSAQDQVRPSLSSSRLGADDPRQFGKQRMQSSLVCRVYPTRDGGFALYESTSTDVRAKLDDIIHRVFEELVRRHGEVR
jgi:hypothetical protein